MGMCEVPGIELILNQEVEGRAPHCPHGPTLLFVKVTRKKQEARRFYACAACRDRKDCNFFQWEDEKVSEARQLVRDELNRRRQPPFTHQQYVERYQQFVALPMENRTFCSDCQILLLPDELDQHSSHHRLGHVSLCQLKRPSLLLLPIENKKTNAQYLFADRTCQFLLNLIVSLDFRRVLCVGTPRLHELIKVRQSENKEPFIKTQLLDIDFRYSQFYSEEEFCHYNMFNHYFFGGKPAFEAFRTFLCQNKGKSVVMVTDPPFGGLVEALAHSFKKIVGEWKTSRNTINEELPIIWIFPYFFEPRIRQYFPTLSMLDYQVDYDNHALYKHGKTGRKQSPVRIFTNLPPKDIILPAEEGYRFCSFCERYVSSANRHCEICQACTSKPGFTVTPAVGVSSSSTLVGRLGKDALFVEALSINAENVLTQHSSKGPLLKGQNHVKENFLETEKDTAGRKSKNQAQKISTQKKKAMKLVIGKSKKKQKRKKQQ